MKYLVESYIQSYIHRIEVKDMEYVNYLYIQKKSKI